MRWSFFWVCVLLSSVALGQSGEGSPERAKALYDEAVKRFQVNQLEEALRLFQEAYLLSSQPAILFNIGQCFRLQQKCEEANRSFSQFLKEVPDAPNRAQAEAFIKECQEPASLPVKEAPPSEPPKSQPAIQEGASLTISTRHPKAVYQVSLQTVQQTLPCEESITQKAPCVLTSVPPGTIRVVVEGSRSFSQDISLTEGESAIEIEQRGYALFAAALSAPVVVFVGASAGALLSGAPSLDSLGIGAGFGLATALLVTPSLLLLDRYKLPPHKALRKTLHQEPPARAGLGVSLLPGGASLGASLSF